MVIKQTMAKLMMITLMTLLSLSLSLFITGTCTSILVSMITITELYDPHARACRYVRDRRLRFPRKGIGHGGRRSIRGGERHYARCVQKVPGVPLLYWRRTILLQHQVLLPDLLQNPRTAPRQVLFRRQEMRLQFLLLIGTVDTLIFLIFEGTVPIL